MLNYSSLVGIPYLKGGRDPKEGLDCLGLCIEAYKRRGILDFPDASAPENREEIHKLMMEGKEQFEEIQKPEEGCIVAFSIRPPYVTHIGVVIGKNEFLHINDKKRSMVTKLNDLFWGKRIKGFYRWNKP